MNDQVSPDSFVQAERAKRLLWPIRPGALSAWIAWTLATTLGWMLSPMLSAAAEFSSAVWDPDEVAAYLRHSPWDLLLNTLRTGAIIGLVLGVFVGLIQRLALRSKTRDALVSALAMTAGGALLCSVSAGGPAQVEGNFVTALKAGIVGGAVAGWIIAVCQWLILRRRWITTNGWVLLTTIAWTAGWTLGWTISGIALGQFARVGYAGVMLLSVLLATIGGALVGLAQWVILRRHVKRAGWWIVAMAASWGLGAIAGPGGLLRGAIVGGVTGAVLIWLTSPRATSTFRSAPD